jgi:hypothetical protein
VDPEDVGTEWLLRATEAQPAVPPTEQRREEALRFAEAVSADGADADAALPDDFFEGVKDEDKDG